VPKEVRPPEIEDLKAVVVVEGPKERPWGVQRGLNVPYLVAQEFAPVAASAVAQASAEDVDVGEGNVVVENFALAAKGRESVEEAYEQGGARTAATEHDKPGRGTIRPRQIGGTGLEVPILLADLQVLSVERRDEVVDHL
jgi:hypothetical protein